MYWANGGISPKIERADLDGSNRHTVITNVTRPSGLTIDFSLGLIFWVDGENKVIECANLNGSNRRTIASELPKPFALTQYKDYIYWADWKFGSIYRANKTNGLDRTRIKDNIEFIMDILVFHSSRQEGLCNVYLFTYLHVFIYSLILYVYLFIFSLFLLFDYFFV